MDELEEYLLELLYDICRSLVDMSDDVEIEMMDTKLGRTFLVKPGTARDLAILIGKEGRCANAIRTIIKCAGMKHGRKFFVEVGGGNGLS